MNISSLSSLAARQKPLRIALFTYSTKPRGSVVHTLELADALHQLGHEVCVYALDKDGSGFDRPLNCRYQPIPAYPVVGDIDRLIRQRIQEFVDYLSDRPLLYDYYHAQDCISANALLSLRQQGRIPHVIRTVHHVDEFNSPYLQDCQERSIREPDCCLCVSAHWQAELQHRYNIHAPRVINGVNRDRFSMADAVAIDALKQHLGLTGYPIYLTVGGIEPRKNSIALLQAFKQVLTVHPEAQLVIAGGSTLFDYQSYREEFFAQVEHCQIVIGQSLILPGMVSEEALPVLYRAADAFVFPSLKEGWGLVVLEAIASDLPVVTANQPPFTEFLTDRQALLVDPTQPGAIAAAMLQAVQPHMALSLMCQSRSICDRFTWAASAKMHLECYQQLPISPTYA